MNGDNIDNLHVERPFPISCGILLSFRKGMNVLYRGSCFLVKLTILP